MSKKSSQRLVSLMLSLLSMSLVTWVNTVGAYTIMGNVSSYEEEGYGITFDCENGRVRLSFLTETMVRVHMAPAGKEFPEDTLHPNENGPYAVVTYDWPGVSYQISEGFDADLEGVVYNIRAGRLHDYQDDVNTYNKDYHFMLGWQVLVAPVLEETEKWDVYLPAGRWVHYWTGKEYTGGRTVTVDAPLYGKAGLPMFVKAGAIIPMMPEMSYIYEKTPDPITIDVYPGEADTSIYTMYDCETVKSPVKEMRFSCSQDDQKIEVSISPSDVACELCVHCDAEPASVVADSGRLLQLKDKEAFEKARKGWYYGARCFYGSDSINTLNIKVPKRPGRQLISINK